MWPLYYFLIQRNPDACGLEHLFWVTHPVSNAVRWMSMMLIGTGHIAMAVKILQQPAIQTYASKRF